MRKRVCNVQDIKIAKKHEETLVVEFFDKYNHYVETFKEYGITLSIQPYYYYNGKYHTEARNTDYFLAFRFRLYPAKMSFAQAKKNFIYKEFFSHKITDISKKGNVFYVKEYPIKDRAVEHFLKQILHKITQLHIHNKDVLQAVVETPHDLLKSWLYINRYKTEVKYTLRGHRLDWWGLLVVILLICISMYLRLKRIHYAR